MPFTRDQLDKILDEIADFHVTLEEDPTLPQLGTRYLQRMTAQCRSYLNRVQYYVQTVGKFERDLRIQVQQKEMDIVLKIDSLLADDPIVRQQPSIGDRRALAAAKLKNEHEDVSLLRLDLMNAQETFKLIKMKYTDLQRANADIKTQRQLVRDDRMGWGDGEGGYTPPEKGGAIPGGLPPAVTTKIEPADLLDPNKRPEDLPEPRDTQHAAQIADFFNSQQPQTQKPAPAPAPAPEPSKVPKPVSQEISYADLLK